MIIDRGDLIKIEPGDINKGHLIIPEGVTHLCHKVLAGRSELTSVTLPQGLVGIGKRAFQGCNNLRDITIPSSVSRIGSRAFQSCTSLHHVTFTAGIITTSADAFAGCSNLTSISIPSAAVNLSLAVFKECLKFRVIIVDNDAPEQIEIIKKRISDDSPLVTVISKSDHLRTSRLKTSMHNLVQGAVNFFRWGDDEKKSSSYDRLDERYQNQPP
jgi:hypothetical protein